MARGVNSALSTIFDMIGIGIIESEILLNLSMIFSFESPVSGTEIIEGVFHYIQNFRE